MMNKCRKNRFRKGMSVLLSAVLLVVTVLGGRPAEVHAEEDAHVHNGVTYQPWERSDSLPTEAGNWYLTKDVTIKSKYGDYLPEGTMKLCLNGKTVRQQGVNHVVWIKEEGILYLYDCTGVGRICYAQFSGIRVLGKLYMYGGRVVSNRSNFSAGVFVSPGAEFYMYDGEISGNTAENSTGGVTTWGSSFYMYGGKISGNTGSYASGAEIRNDGIVTVGGNAVISGNSKKGVRDNFYLCPGDTIRIDKEKPLSGSASIGITTRNKPTAEKPIRITTANDADYSNYFFSDDEDYAISDSIDHSVWLTVKGEHNVHVAESWSYDDDNHWKQCFLCGEEFEAASSHTFGEWVPDKEATEDEDGEKHRECSICGFQETETIPAGVPTASPAPTATATSIPTATPVPTATATPAPTATATPVPTATVPPMPTASPAPTATVPPVPTASPVPTATAIPIATVPPALMATATPIPTAPTPPAPEKPSEAPMPTLPPILIPTLPPTPLPTQPATEKPSEVPMQTPPAPEKPSEVPIQTPPAIEKPSEAPMPTLPPILIPTLPPTSLPTQPAPEKPSGVPIQTPSATEKPSSVPIPTQSATEKPTATVCPGEISLEVEVVGNAPETQVFITQEELLNLVLTDEDKQQLANGQDVRIRLVVTDISDTVSDEDKALAEASFGVCVAGRYLDISLYKQIGNTELRITKPLAGSIPVVLTVPDHLKNTDSTKIREFAVARVHDGAVEILSDVDQDEGTVTVETDRFSTYVLVYKDTVAGGNNGSGNSGNTSGNGGNSQNNGGGVQTAAPGSGAVNTNNTGSVNSGGKELQTGGKKSSKKKTDGKETDDKNTRDKSDSKNSHDKKSGGSAAGHTRDGEPKTGDETAFELAATLAMVSGLSYVLLYFLERRRGMTEETKKEITARIIAWAKRGGRLRKGMAIAAICVFLVYYHSIGKEIGVEWREAYDE